MILSTLFLLSVAALFIIGIVLYLPTYRGGTLVYARDTRELYKVTKSEGSMMEMYPINGLRYIARESGQTSFYFPDNLEDYHFGDTIRGQVLVHVVGVGYTWTIATTDGVPIKIGSQSGNTVACNGTFDAATFTYVTDENFTGVWVVTSLVGTLTVSTV